MTPTSETLLELRMPEPLSHQLRILASNARFKVVVCGRRWGKTASGLQMTIRGHGQRINGGCRINRGALEGANIWWVAPSYPVSSDIWRDLKRASFGCYVDKSEVERRIEFPGGGAITVKSADNPDSLRGAGLHGVVIDEAASVAEEVWKESLRPALSDKMGWAVFIGTPKGFNWLWELFAAAENRPGWERWQRPSTDNPLITQAELDDALRDMGSFAFNQEYMAQFLAGGGSIFKREWLCKFFDNAPKCDRYVRYWDKAGTLTGDWSVGFLMGQFKDFYCIDVVRDKWTPDARDAVIEQTAEIDRQKYGDKVQLWVEKEPGQAANEVRIIQARRWARFSPYFDTAITAKKSVRWRPWAAACESGIVHFKRDKWNKELFDELVAVTDDPKEYAHDDQADSGAGAFNKLTLAPTQGVGMPRGFKSHAR